MLISDFCAELDVMCIILMLMLTLKTVSLSKSLSYQKMYLIMMLDAVILVISDLIYELNCSDVYHLGNFALYLVNDIYFIASITVSYIWFLYTIEISTGIAKTSRVFLILASIPAAVLIIAEPFTYLTKWVFYFDSEGYHRGVLNYAFAFIPMGYFLFACIRALVIYIRKRDRRTREVFETVTSFAVFPILAVIVQVVTGLTFPAVCVGAALGMLQVFLTLISLSQPVNSAE